MDLPYDPVTPLLGIYRQDLGTAQVPVSRQVDKKLWYSHTVEYHSATKKKEILPFVTAWMDLERIMLSEISQSEKDKYYTVSLIRGI